MMKCPRCERGVRCDERAKAKAKVAKWFRPLHDALTRAEATAERCRIERERLAEQRRELQDKGYLGPDDV